MHYISGKGFNLKMKGDKSYLTYQTTSISDHYVIIYGFRDGHTVTNSHTHPQTHTYTHICTHECTHMHICTHERTHTYTHTRTQTQTNVRTKVISGN